MPVTWDFRVLCADLRDNAKKYIEEGNFGGKGPDPHKGAVIGDTLSDRIALDHAESAS